MTAHEVQTCRARCAIPAAAACVAMAALLVATDVRGAAAAAPAAPAATPAARTVNDGAKPPKEAEISYFYDLFYNSFARPVTRATDPALAVRKLTRHPREAVNVDADDEVRLPSTWWQPRVGHRLVTPEQLVHGPGAGTGPAPGPITLTKAKNQGATPGFYITDGHGDKFIVKFDPPDRPELASGADVIASVLLWGAGYNVPDDAIFWFRRDDVKLGKKVELTEAHGRKRPMRESDIDALLAKVARMPDGRYRAVASRLLDGKPVGPFRYEGRRGDDPEDLIPHEHRRELRGLWPMAAWLAHGDARAANTLDVWVTDGGRSFVRHHLIDFNGCLGSGSVMEKTLPSGNEYDVDWGVMTHSLATLGLTPFRWEAIRLTGLPCVDPYDVTTFDPEGWRPDYPNPAFDQRTARDIRWGVRIVAGFSDDLIRAAVARAAFSDPRCGETLARILIGRRDKLAQRWLGAMPARTAIRAGGQR
jgi:hypothetical protein